MQFFQAISLRRIERVPYELRENNSRSFLELMLFSASFEDSMTKLVKYNQLNIFLRRIKRVQYKLKETNPKVALSQCYSHSQYSWLCNDNTWCYIENVYRIESTEDQATFIFSYPSQRNTNQDKKFRGKPMWCRM